MCKLTRNAHSTALAARRGQLARPPPIRAKEQHSEDNLAQLPKSLRKENAPAVVEEMVVVKETEKNYKLESSSASTAAARPAAANAPHSADTGSATESVNASLRAISALCLPEAPNVVLGAVIRECLLGQVCHGSYALGNNQFLPVVVKEFNLLQVLSKTTRSGHGLHEDALTELQIHAYVQKKQLRNAIGLYAMHLDAPSNKLFAYLEYAGRGELFSIVQARGAAALPTAVAGSFFVQLLHGIQQLHDVNVVHRDLSLENVLLTQDMQLKICDFGLAAICPPGGKINDGRVVGKVKYMCPELYYGEEYDPRLVDIWSAAVIFFLMLTGIFPYERPSADDPRLVLLCHGQINELLAHWKRPALDEELLQVFTKMFCPPQQRWTAQQLLQLPFCQRFASVSPAAIAAEFAKDAAICEKVSNPSSSSSNSMNGDRMSAETATPSVCSSTGSGSNSDSNASMVTSPAVSFSGSPTASPVASFKKCQIEPAMQGACQVLTAVHPCG